MSLITSGWLGRPAGSKVGLRRSTLILILAFFGLGALYLQIRTDDIDQRVPIVVFATTTTLPNTTP